MPREYAREGGNRKKMILTDDEVTYLRERSPEPISAQVRGIVEGFLDQGSTYRAAPTSEVVFVMDRARAREAERIAKEHYGCSLRDIVRHQLAQERAR